MQSNGENSATTCLLVHDLINKVAIILGYCELLSDEAVAGSESAKRLGVVQKIAKGMAESLKEHHCNVAQEIRRDIAKAVTESIRSAIA